jgi:AraC-like DNA-binding protein
VKGTLSVQIVRAVIAVAARVGLEPAQALAAAGGPSALEDVDGRVSARAAEALCRTLQEHIGLARFARALARPPVGDNALDLVVRNSATMGQALRREVELFSVSTTLADLKLIEAPRTARLLLVPRQPLAAPLDVVAEILFVLVHLARIREATGTHALLEGWLRMRRPGRALARAISETAGGPVRFGATETAVVLPSSILDEPVREAKPVIEAASLVYVDALRRRLERDVQVRSRLARELLTMLPLGELTLGAAARRLATTPRTLQRKLRDEGTSFQQVIDEVRREMTVALIRDHATPTSEIAFVLGFRDLSSFHRAFKRWMGIPPGEFRRQEASI